MKQASPMPKTSGPHISPRLLRLFSGYSRYYLRRNFHTIRVANDAWIPESDIERPIVIYLNHASWWDPLICLYLARRWLSDRISLAPIDAEMLKQYAFFKHLGFYPVELGTARGARNFLRTTAELLQSEGHVLWLTPQARFVDPRERPIPFRRGLGALASRVEHALYIPMAIDYTFWTEPQPEVLISFGQPVVPEESIISSTSDWTTFFAGALEEAQDDLMEKACRRDSSDWFVLEQGASGINAIYDGWRSLRSRMRGETFAREHQPDRLEV
jgi:1-acyl-sn-glycerol-3-phosphate acyltransferase